MTERELVTAIRGVRVLVVGDVMLDRHLMGEAERLSPEAPVPVVRIAERRVTPGGAANVAANVTAAGGTCALVGVVAEDAPGAELRAAVAGARVRDLMLTVRDRPTTNKTRVVARNQQVVRIDEEREAEVSAEDRAQLAAAASDALAEAQVLRDAKLWRDASDVLAQANKKFPDDVDMIYEQSMMAEKLNRLADMERLLRRVIALKPDHQHAYNALGYSFAERNVRLPEARTLIKKALELSPGEPSITDSLGWVEYRLGNRDEAVRLLREAYRGQPDAEIAAHLGEVLWVTGQTDEARKVWREGRKRDAANDVLRETLARLRVDL